MEFRGAGVSMIRFDAKVVFEEVNSSDYNTMISSGDLTSGGTFNKICLSTSWQRTIVNLIMIVLVPFSVSIKESSMQSRDVS